MNRKWMPHGITAGALAVFIVLGLACATASKWADVSYHGEADPVLEGKVGTMITFDGSPPKPVEFRSGGKMILGNQSNCTWKRAYDSVMFVANNGWYYGEGKYYPETQKIMGECENSEGTKWNFTIELGSSPGASASSSQQPSSQNYFVTVWFTSSGTRMSSSMSVTAGSKGEAEREAERQWKSINGWNTNLQFIEAVANW
jgi:hypothetical protein